MKEKIFSITLIALLVVFYPGMHKAQAQSHAPYKGGAGDGYAMAELLVHATPGPTGIAGTLEEELLLYPAPVKKGQELFVHAGANLKLQSLRFFDINGNLLFEDSQSRHFEEDKAFKLAIAHFPAGIYFLQAESLKGTITKKVIIL